MRDLSKVWSDDLAQEEGFNASNTLMIDSEYRKVRNWVENSIVVTPYSKDEVIAPKTD